MFKYKSTKKQKDKRKQYTSKLIANLRKSYRDSTPIITNSLSGIVLSKKKKNKKLKLRKDKNKIISNSLKKQILENNELKNEKLRTSAIAQTMGISPGTALGLFSKNKSTKKNAEKAVRGSVLRNPNARTQPMYANYVMPQINMNPLYPRTAGYSQEAINNIVNEIIKRNN